MGKVYKVNAEKCVGCGLCAQDCPTKSINIVDGKAIISDNCVACRICARVCKRDAVVLSDDNSSSVECNSCPVHCNIPEGKVGACRRYRNSSGEVIRIEPLNIVDKSINSIDKTTGLPIAPLMLGKGAGTNLFSTNVPARFVGEDVIDGVEVVSCVTEAVLSFNGARVKVDTDENLGSNGSPVRRDGKIVGYINTSEYGSRMIYFGGAELNTGSGGFTVARTVSDLLNKRPVTVKTDMVKELVLQHGQPPIVDGKKAPYMRVGCGSMIVSAYCKHWMPIVDEVIAIDYDITAKLSSHTTSGARYNMRPTGITPVGEYSSPGRYFGTPGKGWGGSNLMHGREAIASIDKTIAWPGLRLVVTEPTAERAAYFELNEELEPIEKPIPPQVQAVLNIIRSHCEPCCCHVSVVSGLGGGFRNVISKVSPMNVNKGIKEGKIKITICGKPTKIWEGGGITAEASIEDIAEGAFTWVPTPAGVCPVEVSMTKQTYEEIGGYLEAVKPIEEIKKTTKNKIVSL